MLFQRTKIAFLQFWRLEGQDQGVSKIDFTWDSSQAWFVDGLLSHGLSSVFLILTTSPYKGSSHVGLWLAYMILFYLITSLKAPFKRFIFWSAGGLRLQQMNLRGSTIQISVINFGANESMKRVEQFILAREILERLIVEGIYILNVITWWQVWILRLWAFQSIIYWI